MASSDYRDRKPQQDMHDMVRLVMREQEGRRRLKSFWRQTAAGLVAGVVIIGGAVYYGVNDPPALKQHVPLKAPPAAPLAVPATPVRNIARSVPDLGDNTGSGMVTIKNDSKASMISVTDRDAYDRDISVNNIALDKAYIRDNTWQSAEDAATKLASPAVKELIGLETVSRMLCRNLGPNPEGSGPCAAQADTENKLAAAGWCFNGDPIANNNTPYWHECVMSLDRLPDNARQAAIQRAADKAHTRATSAVRVLLEKEAVANEACRGGNEDASGPVCTNRDRLDDALSKAGWCYVRYDDESAADSYWHDCRS